jgi:hypothetical protein
MPAAIDEIVKRRVIQQWLGGESRDKIAIDNNIGSGTVSSIVNNYKIGLDNSEFNSVIKPVVSERFKLDQATEGLSKLKDGKITGRGVINP